MAEITSFRDLIAWQLAMDLAERVYALSENFPRREWFGLAQQMRKSAVSVPSNIAEGTRHRTASYVHHLRVALGSHGELDTQCELATRTGFIGHSDWSRLEKAIAETGRVTHGLLRSLEPTA